MRDLALENTILEAGAKFMIVFQSKGGMQAGLSTVFHRHRDSSFIIRVIKSYSSYRIDALTRVR